MEKLSKVNMVTGAGLFRQEIQGMSYSYSKRVLSENTMLKSNNRDRIQRKQDNITIPADLMSLSLNHR
jgi:hypothetical protein